MLSITRFQKNNSLPDNIFPYIFTNLAIVFHMNKIPTSKQKELRKLAQRGLRVIVVSRPLSDGSIVYSVQLVDLEENSVLMLAELDAINGPKAQRMADDIRETLARNSVVNVIA